MQEKKGAWKTEISVRKCIGKMNLTDKQQPGQAKVKGCKSFLRKLAPGFRRQRSLFLDFACCHIQGWLCQPCRKIMKEDNTTVNVAREPHTLVEILSPPATSWFAILQQILACWWNLSFHQRCWPDHFTALLWNGIRIHVKMWTSASIRRRRFCR